MKWTPDATAMHAPFTTVTESPLVQCCHLSRVRAQDVRVTSIEDSHRRAPEELTARGAELDLYHAPYQYVWSLHSLRWQGCFAGLKKSPSRAAEAPSLGWYVCSVGGREAYVVPREVVNGGLGEHAVV